MSKHSPEPWRFAEAYGKRPPWERIESSDGRTICGVQQATGGGLEPHTQSEAEANAHLLLSAPELAAALHAIVDQADPIPGGWKIRSPQMMAARAVLARAKV